ncbi:Hsp70 protein-domain-containing protein [Dipodascopsis tothii]|uniref:Hsp70 protein-domain-containing protein n=1 Tax=Dipodascopsis tothii TaxID=44089 RepID=UPI0034CEF544
MPRVPAVCLRRACGVVLRTGRRNAACRRAPLLAPARRPPPPSPPVRLRSAARCHAREAGRLRAWLGWLAGHGQSRRSRVTGHSVRLDQGRLPGPRGTTSHLGSHAGLFPGSSLRSTASVHPKQSTMRISVAAVLALTLAHTALGAVLGIDFGQQNTKAALVAPGVPFEIVLSRDSKRKDISGVAFKGDERIYGSNAATLAARFPDSAFLNVKPLLAKSVDSVEAQVYQSTHPGVALVPAANRSTVAFRSRDLTMPIEEVLATSFSHIKTLASEMLAAGETVRDVAITVPPSFTAVQRAALVDAAEIAGLRVVSLVTDGVAVALNYASSRQYASGRQRYIVYDMGAGSTSATVVSLYEKSVKGTGKLPKTVTALDVEGVAFDDTLGGDLLSKRIYDILLARYVAEHDASINESPRALVRLHREAERLKNILSANTDTRFMIESLHNDVDFSGTISRMEFEAILMISGILDRVAPPALTALEQAGLSLADIDAVILTGGSTRVPAVQKHLIDGVLGGDAAKLSKAVNADEAAVMGTAFRGVAVSKQFKAREIDVTEKLLWPFDVVVEADGVKYSEVLFAKGTRVARNVTSVPLAIPAAADSALLTFRERGQQLYQHELVGLQESRSQVADKYTCETLQPVLEVELTASQLFDVVGVAWRCNTTETVTTTLPTTDEDNLKQKVLNFFGKGGDEAEAESGAETETTTTAAAPKTTTVTRPRVQTQPIRHKVHYASPRNMGRATKQASTSRLRAFDKLDDERRRRDQARNELEGYSYKLRQLIVDAAELAEEAADVDNESTEYTKGPVNHRHIYVHSTADERAQTLELIENALDAVYAGEAKVDEELAELAKHKAALKEFEDLVAQRWRATLTDAAAPEPPVEPVAETEAEPVADATPEAEAEAEPEVHDEL